MADNVCNLTDKQCKPCEGGVPPLSEKESRELLQQLDGWTLSDNRIGKTFSFKNYYQVMAFVNAVAWMTHREDHHPDMSVGYSQCRVEYSTHAIGGLSENDFICAAKVDALFKL
ncbi:4a-hydroxytetrahydrobiopterin dehydratase [Sideroxydans lithotrophicus]|uniref:Putative pterin-4-alpha-carbinolamine dehydratase n=1 Tax=Sideroxydans lithotrophicus (strain ES-1) TaxID=580332 RepID=D5CQP2_SIDLE|nr:4a-hydroxytetrahydrobiopterin dehydratase [Sideroxydans lithotrophicus]ADE11278.1 transcriptional coactivator/pterin dehydratase [Sideroxydans lithotrophicus ES-1]